MRLLVLSSFWTPFGSPKFQLTRIAPSHESARGSPNRPVRGFHLVGTARGSGTSGEVYNVGRSHGLSQSGLFSGGAVCLWRRRKSVQDFAYNCWPDVLMLCESTRKNSTGIANRKPVRRATAGVKCLVLCVRRQWVTCHGGQQHRNIGRMTNQMTRCLHLHLSRIRHDFRLHERDQTRIIVQYTVRPCDFKCAQSDQKVLFNFVAHSIGKNNAANPRRAQ